MALTWDATATEWVKLPDDEKEALRQVLDALIMGTIVVGWGELTEEGADEWLARYVAIMSVYGEGDEWLRLVAEKLPLFYGLRTNVFPKESAAKFAKRLGTAALVEAKWKIERLETAEAA